MQNTNKLCLIACHDCDLLFSKHPLQNGERATCPRCNAILYKKKPDTLNRTLTHSITALILFVLANIFPFMTLQLKGLEQITLLTSGGVELFRQGFWILGILVLAFGCLLPFLKIVGTIYVLLPLKYNRIAWKAKVIFRFVGIITPWAMMEVLMLGVLVAYVKLIDLATISLGISLYSFAGLIIFMAIITASLDTEEIWEKLESAQ